MRISLSSFLLLACRLALGILTMLISYLLVMASLAFFNLLPPHLEASFELPVQLKNPMDHYKVENLTEHLYIQEIEIKQANLEIRTKDRSWPQGIGYLHAAIYLSFFFFSLFYLGKIFKSFELTYPFSSGNPVYIRNIGFLSIGLGVYEFLIMLFVCSLFHDKFRLLHGNTLEFPSLWELNISAIFLGFVLISLAEVFKQGKELQDLESQTI